MTTIKLEDFKLPENVDRIKITGIQNGLNRFYYNGKELSEYGTVIIPVSNIKRGLLKYEVNSSIVNMKEIVNNYIKEGWKLDRIIVDTARFIKEGYPIQHVYIGDTNANIIFYSYAVKKSFIFVGGNSLRVLLDTRKKNKYSNPYLVHTFEVEDDIISFKFKDLIEEAISVKVMSSKHGYFITPPDGGVFNADETITLRYEPYRDEIRRIITGAEKQGYSYLGIHQDHLYFRDGDGIRKYSMPSRPTTILFKISTDGATYSHMVSKVHFVKKHKEETEKPLFLEAPFIKSMDKIVRLSHKSTIAIPNEVTHKIVEVNE